MLSDNEELMWQEIVLRLRGGEGAKDPSVMRGWKRFAWTVVEAMAQVSYSPPLLGYALGMTQSPAQPEPRR